jgi:hypothetical protein
MSRLGLALAALMLLQTLTTHARQGLPRATPESVGLSSERLAEATALLNQFVTNKKIAGAVAAVARKGHVGYLTAVGVQDLETQAAMTDRSFASTR